VRLPLFRNAKQSQAVVQAERDLEASRAETEGAGIESAAAVQALLSRIEAVRAHHVTLEQAVLPQARAALDAARAAWESGAADFPTVLDDMRALLADARALEDLEAERLRALVALEPLTGRALLLPAGATP
jgi:outer membrane protein TolC